MKATDVYQQDTIVTMLFDGGQQLTIDTGGRENAEGLLNVLDRFLGYFDDVSFTVRFT